MEHRPEFTIIAGPNGAGKIRLCPFYISTSVCSTTSPSSTVIPSTARSSLFTSARATPTRSLTIRRSGSASSLRIVSMRCDKGIESPSGNPRRNPRQTGSRSLLFRHLPLFRCYHLECLADEGVKMKQRRCRFVSGTARVSCPDAP